MWSSPLSGRNGCWKKGDEFVRRDRPLRATITPYDRAILGRAVCTSDLPEFDHSVTFAADVPGEFMVNVGTLLRSSTGKDSLGIIHRTVIVR